MFLLPYAEGVILSVSEESKPLQHRQKRSFGLASG